jgi:DhnA family fructose-bisphosphate aldolase class Ia
MNGKDIRMSRLFSGGKHPVIVAMDHGQTFGPVPGLIDFTAAAERLAEADGVLLAPQMLRFSGNLFKVRGAPLAITRLTWNTRLCEPWGYHEAQVTQAMTAERALALGADAIMAGIVLQTGSEWRDTENVSLFTQIAEECHRLGLPLIGEVFPAGEPEVGDEAFQDYILKGCRIIAELGAEAVKTFYTGPRFQEIVEATPVPVFALGAQKLENPLQALELAQTAIKAGARGVVFGRNVIQAAHPDRFLRALKAVVKDEVAPADAVRQFGPL